MSFNHSIVYRVPEKFIRKDPNWGNEGACASCKNAMRAESGYVCKKSMQGRELTDKGFYACGYMQGLPAGDKEPKNRKKKNELQ